MEKGLAALVGLAAWLGLIHTIVGPDHYLPFIMIAWARKWSSVKTALITFFCGLGHIGSSVAIGFVGIALGLAIRKVEGWESSRGDIAAWLLIAFGLAYMLWGLRRAYRNKPHTHGHYHLPDQTHEHEHSHDSEHSHVHGEPGKISITPWMLFVIFVFGPCEPLIPIVMYPAAKGSIIGVILVTTAFGAVTIGTMLCVVMLGRAGINFLPLGKLNRYAHALSGAAIFLCGLAIVYLGL